MPINTKLKQQLKGQAHKLKPVVMLGNHGFSDAVKKELERALTDHELIKVRIASTDREMRKQIFAEISESTGAELIQTIGSIGVLYRKRAE